MPRKQSTRPCTFPHCDKPHFGRGLCKGHHSQQRTGKPLSPLRPYRTTRADKFWSHVTKGADDECWCWAGYRSFGYGHFKHRNKTVLAHRLSWEIHRGPIPAGQWVLHLCNNPACVNPNHLELGDHARNMAYAAECGRAFRPRGELHGLSKLSAHDVLAIREMYAEGGILYRELAVIFGVGKAAIGDIIRKRRWPHV